jgi:hypothetical protein
MRIFGIKEKNTLQIKLDAIMKKFTEWCNTIRVD